MASRRAPVMRSRSVRAALRRLREGYRQWEREQVQDWELVELVADWYYVRKRRGKR